MAKFTYLLPFRTFSACDLVGLLGNEAEVLDIPALGIDLKKFLMNGDTAWMISQCFLENFFSLQIATICQVDISLGNRIDIVTRIQLAGRVNHGRRIAGVIRLRSVHAGKC